MSQTNKRKIAGQLKAIAEHEKKKATYSDPHDKQFAQKTINNATKHLNKLQKKGN